LTTTFFSQFLLVTKITLYLLICNRVVDIQWQIEGQFLIRRNTMYKTAVHILLNLNYI
jgi:hypothetical protein